MCRCGLPIVSPDLVVKGQEGDRGIDGFPGLGAQPHHLQFGPVDLLGQLIHSNVAGGTHQYLPAVTSSLHYHYVIIASLTQGCIS